MSNNPNLQYSRYPVYPELRCGNKCGANGANKVNVMNQKPGVAYKNGVPYDCKCDRISAPYSMPYDANKCKSCQPPYHAVCNNKGDPNSRCKCHTRATRYNNNMYEAFNFPGYWNTKP